MRLTPSPRMPLSRKVSALSGDTTNGGFDTMRSNRSSFTGSKKLPARHSTFVTPLSAALKDVNSSARSLMSHATTRFACLAARTLWIPPPQPTSRTSRTVVRIVRLARKIDDVETPIT
jgi:hypothetical protein